MGPLGRRARAQVSSAPGRGVGPADGAGRGQPTGRGGASRRGGAGLAAGLGRPVGCLGRLLAGRCLDGDIGAMEAGGCRYQFRIALLGDAAVGKTSLLRRFVAGAPGAPEPEHEPEGAPTVGVEFYSRKLQLRAGPRVKLQLWDTAGHERFRCGPGGLRELAGCPPSPHPEGSGLSGPGAGLGAPALVSGPPRGVVGPTDAAGWAEPPEPEA